MSTSCALVDIPRVPRRVPFNEADFAAYRGAGSSTVAGQVIVKSSDGETHIGAGTTISLLPVTSYTREMVEREIGNGEYLTASDPRFQPYVHLQTTDDSGHFVFDHVRAGEYYVAALAEWSFADDTSYQWACERIAVGTGQTVRVKVSKDVHHPNSPGLVISALQ
ncbi:MAG: hypothetical protein ACAI37_23780 [Chthoniobacter sp.]